MAGRVGRALSERQTDRGHLRRGAQVLPGGSGGVRQPLPGDHRVAGLRQGACSSRRGAVRGDRRRRRQLRRRRPEGALRSRALAVQGAGRVDARCRCPADAGRQDPAEVGAGSGAVSALLGRTRRLALRGPDLMLLARPPRWKGALPSHNTLLAVECDGPVSAERITRALDRFLDRCPWPAARLRRPFPWGELHWAAGERESLTRPPVRHVALDAGEQLDRVLAPELNTPIDPRHEAPLRILSVDGEATGKGAGSFLVLTWFHPLMDARGGQNFLDLLNHCDGDDGVKPWDDTCPAL